MSNVDPNDVTGQTNNKTKLKNAFTQLMQCMDRIDAEREQIKDTCKVIKELGYSPKIVKAVASATQKGKLSEKKTEVTELDDLIEELSS